MPRLKNRRPKNKTDASHLAEEDTSGMAHIIRILEGGTKLTAVMIWNGELYYAHCPQILLTLSGDTQEEAFRELLGAFESFLDGFTEKRVVEEMENAEEEKDSLLEWLLEPEAEGKPAPVIVAEREILAEDFRNHR